MKTTLPRIDKVETLLNRRNVQNKKRTKPNTGNTVHRNVKTEVIQQRTKKQRMVEIRLSRRVLDAKSY